MTTQQTPEARWISWLEGADDARTALRAFCPHYFYFSYRQVIAFPGLFGLVDPFDRASLAMLASVLHEELGEGDPERVHSVLFERFAQAVGADPAALKIPEDDVLPGVRAYVAELERVFTAGPREDALATYVFLESSAVETYGPLVGALRSVGLSEADVEFFSLHATVEEEHARLANEMLQRYGLSPEHQAVAAQTQRLAGLWHDFWSEIDELSRAAVA